MPSDRVACRNHPDREGHAFYRDETDPKKYGFALCLECFDQRLTAKANATLEQHSLENALFDYLTRMLGDGVKKVYPSELAKMSSLRFKP